MSNYNVSADLPLASLSVYNGFAETLNKRCFAMGKNLTPFCMFPNKVTERFGVLNLLSICGLDNPNVTLFDDIVNSRVELFRQFGIYLSAVSDLERKNIVIDFLLSCCVCYIEVPKTIVKNGKEVYTYDKIIATKNTRLMADWVSGSQYEMQRKYGRKVSSTQVELCSDNISSFVRLNSSKTKGNSISIPRNGLPTEHMTCVPLFMLNAYMLGLREKLETGLVKFTYLKDNRTLRELPTTLNRSIMMDYYNSSQFADNILNSVDIYKENIAGMQTSSNILRGYAMLPEVGASKYDLSGKRALNLSRIIRVEEVDEVDRTFIEVDIDDVDSKFMSYVYRISHSNAQGVFMLYKALTGNDFTSTSTVLCVSEIDKFVKEQKSLMSTSFLRQLHLFMIGNPAWFTGYTGKRVYEGASIDSPIGVRV